jgi:hypothetical protein
MTLVLRSALSSVATGAKYNPQAKALPGATRSQGEKSTQGAFLASLTFGTTVLSRLSRQLPPPSKRCQVHIVQLPRTPTPEDIVFGPRQSLERIPAASLERDFWCRENDNMGLEQRLPKIRPSVVEESLSIDLA